MNFLRNKAKHIEETLVNEWIGGWTPAEIPDMRGKVAVITGGNSGIGLETARKLAENGARVLIVSRDRGNGDQAAQRIRNEVGKTAQVEVLQCDLAALRNVVALAQEIRSKTNKLDLLFLNAALFHPGPFALTEDKIEQTLAVNYYAHALLTLSLLDLLRNTPGSRCIFTSSVAEASGRVDWSNLTGEKYKDSGMIPYGTTKVYMMLFSRELSTRVPEVDFFCVHPGAALTPLQYKIDPRYFTGNLSSFLANTIGLTSYQGAYSMMYAATKPELRGKHWAYFGPNLFNMWPTTERKATSRAVYNPSSYWQLFEETVKILDSKVGRDAKMIVPHHPDEVTAYPARENEFIRSAQASAAAA